MFHIVKFKWNILHTKLLKVKVKKIYDKKNCPKTRNYHVIELEVTEATCTCKENL